MVDRTGLSDEDFIKDLRHAYFVERKVADKCVLDGAVRVIGPDYQQRPRFADRGKYKDTGDLFVRWEDGGPLLRYEVKWRDVDFTGPHDFPFDPIFVDEVENMDAKEKVPDTYIIVNRAETHALRIKMKDAPLSKMWHTDKRYHRQIQSYCVPRCWATGLEF